MFTLRVFFLLYFVGIPNGDFNKLAVNNANISSKIETPNVKKRHRRAKSGGLKSTDPSQGDGEYDKGLFSNKIYFVDTQRKGLAEKM